MTKIDALREAVACESLSMEARLAIAKAVQKYDDDKASNRDRVRNENRRTEVLRFMKIGVPATASQIAKTMNDDGDFKYVSRYWADFNANSVASLLKEAVKRGDVVVDHKEKSTITISPWFKPDFEKEIMVAVYRRVR